MNQCPELESLFLGIAEGDEGICEHAFACPACSAVMEDHRQLEKDLFRLVDPLPPMDFTAQVMAKVAAAPAPVASEVKAGLGILAVSLALLVLGLVTRGGSLAEAGTVLARGLLTAHDLGVALFTGLQAVWGTAAIPFVAVSLVLLVTSLLGLRRLTAAPQSA
ncbi:MAG: hypothetical protein M3Y59_03375 [Myxococcota bacterium]|nr:hypothetical protein [Myxococcota bacterium]